MAYFTGSAVDMTALRAALVNACTASGWSWSSSTEMLVKGSLFMRMQLVSGELVMLGRTSAGAGDAPNVVKIGKLLSSSGQPTYEVSWPANYEIFTFSNPDEIYMVVNYDVDRYQWCSFGQSSLQVPGTGMWVAASLGGDSSRFDGIAGMFIIGTAFGGFCTGGSNRFVAPAWGWNTSSSVYSSCPRNLHIHSDLDAQGWLLSQALTDAQIGVQSMSELISTQPSVWNSEAVLLPMRAYKIRPSTKVSLVADLVNARHIRIDNYAPGEIITLGSDRWKVFPWHQKNAVLRNGSPNSSANSAITHTGTFGWAIRYEGA